MKVLFDCRGVWCNVFLYCFLTVVAEDNHGMLFNGSNVSSTHEVTKVQFSGLDWEYGRPQNGPEFLMASGTSTEDVTVAVSICVSTGIPRSRKMMVF